MQGGQGPQGYLLTDLDSMSRPGGVGPPPPGPCCSPESAVGGVSNDMVEAKAMPSVGLTEAVARRGPNSGGRSACRRRVWDARDWNDGLSFPQGVVLNRRLQPGKGGARSPF